MLTVDAPAVAVAWSWATADAAGASFTWRHACVVGLATAAVYLLDRRLDVARLAGGRSLPLRHAWTAARPDRTALVAAAAGVVAAALAARLPPASLAWGAGVAVAAAGLVLAPGRVASGPRRRPAWRPLAVGMVFSGGVGVAAAAGTPTAVLPALAGLAAVAALNVAMIAAWERDLDDGSRAAPGASPASRPGAGPGRPRRAAIGVALAAASLAAAPALAGLGPSLALAAGALAALELVGSVGPGPEARHLAADGALLLAMLPLLTR